MILLLLIYASDDPGNQAGDGGWMGHKNRRMGGKENREQVEIFWDRKVIRRRRFRKEQKRSKGGAYQFLAQV